MQRARRLASIAVVAVLAVTGLSACRNQPGTAAQFGGTTITQADVDKVYTDAQDKLTKAVDTVRKQQAATPDPSAPPVPVIVTAERERLRSEISSSNSTIETMPSGTKI